MVQSPDSHDDVYDRQIRLWGSDAQKRMSNARVLYLNLTGVSCEILKNLVLAGVAAVVCDNRLFPDAVRELPCSFFGAEEMEQIVREKVEKDKEVEEPESKKAKMSPTTTASVTTVASAIQPKIDELNPLLAGRNSIDERNFSSLPDDYFCEFDAIVATRLTAADAKRISCAIRKWEDKKKCSDTSESGDFGKLFIVTDTFGFDGCAFLDFGRYHTYRKELGKDKLSDILPISPYHSMEEMMDCPLEKVKGRWDKVPPRILVLHKLFMDYWGEIQLNKNNSFVEFAEKWLSSNNLSIAHLELQLDQLTNIGLHSEISPVCAVLGGVLGNEVIKALTGKGEPANNLLLLDGLEGGCRSFLLKTE